MTDMFRQIFSRFRRDETGAVTVEATLWLPFFILSVVAIGDLAVIFHAQTRALETAEDGIRRYSTGEIETPGATSIWIENTLSPISPNAYVETSQDRGLISSVVEMPINDINGFGIFSALADFDIRVTAHQVMEFEG